jgi:hypothetical protein
MLGTTQQDLVPQTDAVIDLLIDVVTGKQLVLIKPTANAVPLEFVIQPPCE